MVFYWVLVIKSICPGLDIILIIVFLVIVFKILVAKEESAHSCGCISQWNTLNVSWDYGYLSQHDSDVKTVLMTFMLRLPHFYNEVLPPEQYTLGFGDTFLLDAKHPVAIAYH